MNFILAHRQSGKFKFYLQTEADTKAHPGQGINYRWHSLPGQPQRGFENEGEALNWLEDNRVVMEHYVAKTKGAHANAVEFQCRSCKWVE